MFFLEHWNNLQIQGASTMNLFVPGGYITCCGSGYLSSITLGLWPKFSFLANLGKYSFSFCYKFSLQHSAWNQKQLIYRFEKSNFLPKFTIKASIKANLGNYEGLGFWKSKHKPYQFWTILMSIFIRKLAFSPRLFSETACVKHKNEAYHTAMYPFASTTVPYCTWPNPYSKTMCFVGCTKPITAYQLSQSERS